ncbi:MAG: tetratricopeptide repeat protein [Lentimicrobiaceae bacterium]|nr:tetratricopeptide repeat protein [Lentimicrobiaceae bacterium]
MKRFYIILILSTLFFSCKKSHTAREFFDLACGYENEGETELAMTTYRQALDAARNEGDTALIGLVQQYMGMLLMEQYSFDEAIEMLHQSAATTKDDPVMISYSNSGIGRAYFIIDSIDKSLHHFQKAVEYAEQSSDSNVMSVAYQNIGAIYNEIGNYDDALNYIRLSLKYNNEEKEIPRYHLNLAYIFLDMNINDSSSYYENILKKELDSINDKTLKVAINHFLYNKALADNNIDSAFHYYRFFAEMDMELLEERLQQNVLEIQKRYDYEKVENDYNLKLIKKQRTLTILLFLLLIIGIFLLILVNRNLQRRKEELRMKDEILKFENEILRLNEIKGDYKRNLEWKYMLVYSMTLMDRNKTESHYKTIKRKIYDNTETAFDAVMKIFEEEHPGLAEAIRQKYPILSDTEYKVGIMSLTPFSSQETADILGKSINTINKARTSIRKKLEIEEKESIEEAISC